MNGRAIYAAVNAVASELAQTGIAKNRVNEVEGYNYRSIDDVMGKLAPILAKHRLCVLPRVLERAVIERADEMRHLVVNVTLKVAFALTSAEDGSSHVVEVYGEALDAGDKATAKAMSAAYKTAMVQTFCIPITGSEDPDRTGYCVIARTHPPEPVQGWEQWCADIRDISGVCESAQAISLVQELNRTLLTALSRERPDLYTELGQAFESRREWLIGRAPPKSTSAKRVAANVKRRKKPSAQVKKLEHV